MTSAISPFASALRRGVSRLGGTMAAFLFSLALAGCGGGGGGSGFLGDAGGNVGDEAGPGAGVVLGSGEGISEERRQGVAVKVAGLDLGGEGKVRAEDVQVSENPEILNQNPFATAETVAVPEAVAEARGFERQSVEEERKTPGYKAFEVAVPADNPLMTVAVWISETAPEEEVELPEGKPERDPEAPRKFLYVRLQVYVSTRNFAAVEGGGVEVLETQVIAVEERLPDPKPPAGADECEAAGWKAARVDGNAINCLIPLTSGGKDFEGCVLSGEFEPLCSEVFGEDFVFPTKLDGEARYVFNCGEGMIPEGSNTIGAMQCFSAAAVNCAAGSLPANGMTQADLNVALRLAARRGDAGQVCKMLRRGAEVNDDLNGTEFTALQEAVSEGHLGVAELLLANGAEVNARKEGAGPSALDLAARAKNAEIAAVLRAAEGRCFLESGGLCEETVVAGVCAAGSLGADGMTQAQLDARMISAAEDGDADAVCEYLRRGANIEAQKTGNLRTALMIAALDGHADVAELLINNGADVNYRGGNGGYGGRPNPGRWRDYPDSNWPALLYAAGWNGNVAVARLLLDNSANIELGDDRNRRPLWEAAFNGHLDMMELLLDRGADVNGADVWGITPLHAPGPHYGYPGDPEWPYAAEVAEYLISRGANVNALDTWGRSPLDLYAGWNHPNAAAVVREAGGRCFVETGPLCEVAVATPEPVVGTVVASDTVCAAGSLSADGMTQAQLDAGLLSAAAANNMAGVCEYLRRGANVDAEGPSDTMLRETALINAAVYGRLEMARLLLNNGADVGAKVRDRGKSDMTALIYASAAGHADVVELLLDEGAEIDATDSRRRGAVYEAAHWGRLDVLELLLSRGVNAGVRDRTGETVLHGVMIGNTIKHLLLRAEEHRGNWVVFWGHTVNPDDARSWAGALEVLLTADGVEVNTRMNDGRSALDYAAQFHSGTDSGFPELAELLRDAGGRCFVRTGPLCEVAVATPEPVVSTVVASDTVCTAGSLSADGMTQRRLNAGLISAARGNDLAGVCEYLRRGANVDAQESEWRYYKRTPLMIAAMDGNLELGKLLRRNGADVNLQVGNYNNSVDAHHYQGNRRMPALHYAAGAGRKEFVEWLLSEGANVRALQALPRDALWEAAFWGRPEIVRILLTAGADANKLATGENLALWDAVHHPTHWAKYGNPRWGVSDAYARPTDEEWVTVISILVANGADVNVREPQGASPLDIAVRRGNAYYAELMREYGSRCFVETGPLCEVAVATPVTSDTVCAAGSLSANGMTERQLTDGLVLATEGNDLPKICEYLRRGANVEAIESGSCYKRTPLMIAANDGNLDAAKLLHANGANVNRQSGNHVCGNPLAWSALMYAAAAGHLEMARWLLDSGAEVEAEWSAGVTALWEAAYWGRPEVLRLLLSHGASWAQQDGWGNTALRRLLHDGAVSQWTKSSWQYKRDALSYSYADPSVDANVLVISLLAEAGADVNNVLNGRSVLDDAVSRGFSRYAEMLRSFGAECRAETGPLCGEVPVAVVSTVVASDTVCAAGSLSADGMTQAQLDAGLVSAVRDNNLERVCEHLRRGASPDARSEEDHPALILVGNGNAAMAELLLANGANPNLRDREPLEWTPLMYSGLGAEVIGLFLSYGADPLMPGNPALPYWHALHEAVYYDRWRVMSELLSFGADPDVWTLRRHWEGTPLHYAARHRSGHAVSVLLAAGAEVNPRGSGNSYSPLDEAVWRNNEVAARMLRDAGGVCFVKTGPLCGSDVMVGVEYSSSANGTVSADVASGGEVAQGSTVAFTATPAEGFYVSGWTGNCASAGAVSDGLDGAAKVCSVSAGADLNVGAVFAEVPSLAGTDCPAGTLPANGLTQAQLDAGLIAAAGEGDLTTACEYLRRGANPNGRDAHQHVPLMHAKAHLDMGELLLANGADKYVLIDGNGWWSPLFPLGGIYTAAQIEFYLSRGVDPNFGSLGGGDYDWRPLHEAAFYGKWNAIKHLLDGGAVPNVHSSRPGWRGRTPLHEAVGDSSDSFHFAIDASNPPFGMIVGNSARAVSVLLEGGAEVNARDGRGYSPLDRAAVYSKTAAAAVLRAAGGRCFVRTGPLCGEARVAVEYSSSANGTVSADVANGGEVAKGATVAFTATPDEGWYVSGWTGGCVDAVAGSVGDGGAKVCSLIAEAALSVGAVFAEVPSLAGPECPGGTMPGNGLTQAELNAQLRLAARNGDTRKICEMLRRGAEVNDNLDGNEFTALQEAVSEGHKAAAEMLLANDAHVNARKGGSGPAPLDLAAQNENAEIAQILRDAHGQCFVETGPLCGEYLPAATLDPSTVAVTSTTTATVAIKDLTCPTEPLSAEGATQSALDKDLLRAMRRVVDQRGYERACNLVRRGADVNYVSDYGKTPLHHVFGDRRMDTPPGWMDVKIAVAKLLIGRGGDVNATDNDEQTPLYLAVKHQCDNYPDFCVRGAEFLIDKGADVDAQEENGWTTLSEAAWMSGGRKPPAVEGMTESLNKVAQALIRAGADPNIKDFEGATSLHDAFGGAVYPVHEENLPLIKTLIDGGADVNAKRDGDWTPLHDAVGVGSLGGVRLLIDNGADVNAENDESQTPLELARGQGNGDIVALLEAATNPPAAAVTLTLSATLAAVPQSVPDALAEELQEDFQEAFNSAPAFGDAFGAAASPGRFLTRLDSLMRATAGTGDVWDSFSGWQKENDFGRVWFSTGQRGDFGFGAGSLGGGESGFGKVLDANPFAALSGNGMLAGGETGFGESGKVRVAAFGDYESQSLLSGEDGKWTRWAASGTAIETAMSEAERFSGLSENKTRGAMTEFHLGGADAGVALQAGAVSESESALGGTARNESLRGLRSRTAFAGLSGSAALLGTGWRLRGAAHVGRSWAESDGMLRSSDLWASAFSAGLERGGWLYSDDGFVLRFSQPLRVEIWERELANDNGVRRMGISPSGRQLDVDAAYRLPLSGGGWLLFSAGVRRDGGHSSGSGVEGGALFAVEKGF